MATKKDQDAKVLKLRNKLLKQEAKLTAAEKPVYVTSGMFRPNQHSDRGMINVKSASESQLVTATEQIMHKKTAFDILGIPAQPHIGSSLEEWIEDFKTRLGVLNKNETLAKITKLKNTIETQLLSTSQKRDIVADDVAGKVDELIAKT